MEEADRLFAWMPTYREVLNEQDDDPVDHGFIGREKAPKRHKESIG